MIWQADKKATEEDRRLGDSDYSTSFLSSSLFLTPWEITCCFINLSGIKGDKKKKKRLEFPRKHLETSWKGNMAEKSQGRVKGQRDLHLLFFSTHATISFPLLIRGDKKNQISNRWASSPSSGLSSSTYGCPTTRSEGGSDPEGALKIMSCILSN